MITARFVISNANEDSPRGMELIAHSNNFDSSTLTNFRFVCAKLLKQNAEKIQGDNVCFGIIVGKTGVIGRAYRKQLDGQGRPAAWRVYGCQLSDRTTIPVAKLIDSLSHTFQSCESVSVHEWVTGKPADHNTPLSPSHRALAEAVSQTSFQGCNSFAFPFADHVEGIDVVADRNGTIYKNDNIKRHYWPVLTLAALFAASLLINIWSIGKYRDSQATIQDLYSNLIAESDKVKVLGNQMQQAKTERTIAIEERTKAIKERDSAINSRDQYKADLIRIREEGLPSEDRPRLEELREQDRAQIKELLPHIAQFKSTIEEFERLFLLLIDFEVNE